MALRLWASRLQAASLPKVSFGEVMEGLCAPCLLAGKQLAHHRDVVFVQTGLPSASKRAHIPQPPVMLDEASR